MIINAISICAALGMLGSAIWQHSVHDIAPAAALLVWTINATLWKHEAQQLRDELDATPLNGRGPTEAKERA